MGKMGNFSMISVDIEVILAIRGNMRIIIPCLESVAQSSEISSFFQLLYRLSTYYCKY